MGVWVEMMAMALHTQQSIETQLADETNLRARLRALSEQLGDLVELVGGALKGDTILPYVPELCRVTLTAFPSPLARMHCQQLWTTMAHSVFQEWTLGMYVRVYVGTYVRVYVV